MDIRRYANLPHSPSSPSLYELQAINALIELNSVMPDELKEKSRLRCVIDPLEFRVENLPFN